MTVLKMATSTRSAWIGPLLLVTACTGVIGDGGGDGRIGPADGTADPAAAGATGPEPGTTPLHRLNRVELTNTLTDLFGADAAKSIPPGADAKIQGFDSNAAVLTLSETTIDSLRRMAEAVAGAVPLASLGACASGAGERACAQQRIEATAPRVLRRPLAAGELDALLGSWDEVRAREDATGATRAVLQRLLMSPDFLYHVEIGDGSGRLTGHELASRLSYLLWETMPDAEGFNVAASGQLATEAGITKEIERLLADPRADRMFQRFFGLWADVDKLASLTKDEAVYPGFGDLRGPMNEEFTRFVGDVLARDGTVPELLSSRSTFVDAKLAELYGVPAPGSGFAKVDLPGTRAGLLTQGAFLALHGKANKSSPILRGVFVLERVLCAPVPPPPPGLANAAAAVITDTTTREYFHTLTSPASCAGCHEKINPIGFAFEGFDGVGRARTTDNGFPVDTRGAITSGDSRGEVSGAAELAQKLANSETVRTCMAANWFRSRYRRAEGPADPAIVTAISAALGGGGNRIRALARALGAQKTLTLVHFAEAGR